VGKEGKRCLSPSLSLRRLEKNMYGVVAVFPLADLVMINIHSACRRAQLEEVKRYLEAGGDIEKKDTVSPRASPLSEACASGRVDIASLLLDNGANISHRDDVR
jgi:hypothetical protein